MCFVPESEIQEILNVITNYIKINSTDGLKDHLADMKSQNKINYCGCDGFFETRLEGDDTIVYLEIYNRVYKFVVCENPYFTMSTHSEVIGDEYDEFLDVD